MDTPELIRPAQLLGRLNSVLHEELDALPTSSPYALERQNSLTDAFKNRKEQFQAGKNNLHGFGLNAIEDMWLISRGAFNYFEHRKDNRVDLEDGALETVTRSVDELSFPALIPTHSWEKIKRKWKVYKPGSQNTIPEDKFQMRRNDEGIQIVGFSSGALTEIDSYIDVTGNSGCPAKGLILNSVFEKYIDTIFRNTILLDQIQK